MILSDRRSARRLDRRLDRPARGTRPGRPALAKPTGLAWLVTLVVLGGLLAACGSEPRASYTAAPVTGTVTGAATGASGPAVTSAVAAAPKVGLKKVGHIFVIVLENEDEAPAFSGSSYLAKTLPSKGQLLTNYYGTAHHSLPNYLAMISGQAPDKATQNDCATYTAFTKDPKIKAPGQAVGNGCVYPSKVKTVADQLVAAGKRWRGYMEGMGTSCRHPSLGAKDPTHTPTKKNQYTTRHNPFMYFRSTLGKYCASRDLDLSKLPSALQHTASTAQLSFIVPDMCDDAHEAKCPDGRPGGMTAANAWLKTWVPKILNSPAYKKDGMLVITFDEADDTSTACCHEVAGPNAAKPGINGPGGGKVGAVVLSPFVKPGTRNATPYNHYSLLASIESAFSLQRLGYAAGATPFGTDVLSR